jgi:hypothetical protein
VARQGAEIIDLEWYRDRRSGKGVQKGSALSELPSVQTQMNSMSFAMPAAFFVFWPTWVFSPQFTGVQPRDGNGPA